jgi:RNA polymerase sigma-32 factor
MTTAEVGAVARELDVRPEDVREMELRMTGGDLALEGAGEEGEGPPAPIAYLEASGAEPTEVLERQRRDHLQGEGVRAALATLDPRSRRIIEARWLAEDDGGVATLHELAAEFGVSAERIRQIESRALRSLRAALSAESAAA